jgi:hypothetical protein
MEGGRVGDGEMGWDVDEWFEGGAREKLDVGSRWVSV